MGQGITERKTALRNTSTPAGRDGPSFGQGAQSDHEVQGFIERAARAIDILEARAQRAEQLAREAHRERRHVQARLGAITARLADAQTQLEEATRRAENAEQRARELENRAIGVIRAADRRIREDAARLARVREVLSE